MNPIKRRVGLIALGTAFALIALEIVLQLVSFAIWVSSSEDHVHDDGARVVLCVGDSFTEGMGASSTAASYPRRLESALSTNEQAWRVYNCGLSGSSSRKLLEKLPRQLDTYRPNVLCVLTGYNDFWDKPEPMPEGEITKTPAGYTWESKVWKLGKMIVHALEGSAENLPESQSLPFLGAWHADSTWFRFLASGRVESESGDLYWFVDGDRLLLRLPTEGKGLEARWEMRGEKLVLTGGPFPGPVELSAGMPERDDVDRGRNAFDAGRYDLAVNKYRRGLAVPALELRARSGLIRALRALRALGADADARVEVDALRTRFEQDQTSELGDRLARGYLDVEDIDRAVAVASAMLVDHPVTLERLSFLLEHALSVTKPSSILPFIDAALERTDLEPALRASLFGGKAQLSSDPIVSFVCLLQAWRVERKDSLVHKTVLADPIKYSRANLDNALATMSLSTVDREAVLSVYAGTFKLKDRTTETLAGHLRRVAELAREAGAEPVFLVYPVLKPQVERAVKSVAADLGVQWIDVRAHFNKLLVTARYEDLFVLDGHCNDRGYEALARLVAQSIR